MYKREYTCATCGYKTTRKQNLEIHQSRKSACEKRIKRKSNEVLKSADNSLLCVEMPPPVSVDCSDYNKQDLDNTECVEMPLGDYNKPMMDHIHYTLTCVMYEETVGDGGHKHALHKAIAKICNTVFRCPANKKRFISESLDAKYIDVWYNNKYKTMLMDDAMLEVLTLISKKLLDDLLIGIVSGVLTRTPLLQEHINILHPMSKCLWG